MLPNDPANSEPSNLPEAIPPNRGNRTLRANVPDWLDGIDDDGRSPASPSRVVVLWRGLCRRWMLAIGLGLLVAVAAGLAAWFLRPEKYTAFALLRIASVEPRLVFDVAEKVQGSGFEVYKRTQIQLIKNRYVINRALRDPRVTELTMVRTQPDPLSWLVNEIVVDYPGEAEILRIALSGGNPRELPVLVNAVKDAYLREIVNAERNQRLDRLSELQRAFQEAEEKTRAKRTDLRRLAEVLGTGDPKALTVKQQYAIEHYAALRKEHIRVRFERMRAELVLAAKKSDLEGIEDLPIPEYVLDGHVEADSQVKLYAARVAQLQNYIEKLESRVAQKGAPALERPRKELESATEVLEARRAEIRPVIRKQLLTKVRAESESPLVQLQNQIALLAEQDKRFDEEAKQYGEVAEKIGRSSVDVEMMRDEIAVVDRVTDRIANQMETLRVELRSPTRVTLVHEADVPPAEDLAKQVAFAALTAVAMFILVALCVSWWESKSGRIGTSAELESGLGIQVVGSLPDLAWLRLAGSNGLWRRLAGSTGLLKVQRDAIFAESTDGIRTMFLHDAGVQSTRVVIVTSAVAREGKTTLASHLAASLARAHHRTLLVDCDFRRPQLHLLFDVALEPGLCEVLRGESSLPEVIRQAPTSQLWILPAGQCNRQFIQGLAQVTLQKVFERLRQEYDFIVVDTSPVLLAPETLGVCQQGDAVLFSILRNVSQAHRVQTAYKRLTTIGIRVLGAVVNAAREDIYTLRYRYHMQYDTPLSV